MVEFVHPGVLFALPLAALPVIIHLLNRRRFVTVRWAAMMYLVQAERQTRRRIRWRNLLVLLLRTLAVLLLVILFARPVVSSGLGATGRAEVVLLLDESASMGAVSGGRSAWDRAREAAAAVAGKAARSGAALRVYVGSKPEPVFGADPLSEADVDALAARLGDLRLSAAALDPVARLDGLMQAEAGEERPVQSVVITDLQATEWADSARAPELAERLAALRRRGGLTLVDAGAAVRTAGIAAMRTDGRIAYADAPHALRVLLESDVAVGASQTGLAVSLDGPALPPYATPAVPAGGQGQALATVFAGEPGLHFAEVRWNAGSAAGDALASDNLRFCAFEAFQDPPALIITRAAVSADEPAPDLYLRTALRPDRGPGMRPETVSYNSGPREDMSGCAVVFACDVPSPGAWARALSRYVEQGGRLVVFLGETADADAWQGTLLAPDGLLPCELGGVVRGEAFRLTDLDYGHPLLQPFEGWDSLFALPRFRAFRQVTPGGGVRVLARYDDADHTPAIMVARRGAGDVLLLNTSPDDAWSDWPRSEGGRVTYVSLVNWLAEQDAPRRLRPGVHLNLVGGERLSYPLDSSRVRPQALLDAPEESGREAVRLQAEPGSGGGALTFTSPPLMAQGIWRLKLTGTDGAESVVPVAVNIPDAERDLRRADARALPGVAVVPWERVAAEATAPSRYWPGVAAVLLAVLLIEGTLAFLFGRPDGARRQQGRAP